MHRFRRFALACCAPVLVAACHSAPIPSGQVLGQWELVGGNNLVGDQRPSGASRMLLAILTAHGDSLFGWAAASVSANGKHTNPCGVLKGVRAGYNRVNLIIPTTDDPSMSMVFSGNIENDSLLVDSFGPKSGKSVVPWGAWLIFRRTSTDTTDRGCLTSA